MKKAVDYLVYLVVRILICVAQAIRIETGKYLTDGVAWFFCDVLRFRGQVIDENLRHAFPDWTEVQRQRVKRRMWRHLFLMVLEVAHAPRKIHETNWRRFVRLKDSDRLVRLLLAGRPTLVITAHFGNFEVGGYTLALLGFPTYTVARTLDNPYIDRFLNQFRGQTGQYMIPKNGGFDQILDVLEHGGAMTLLADQYAGRKGCWVEFFNRPASAHKAIALLALENDASVVIASVRRLDRPLLLEMDAMATADPRKIREEFGSITEMTQWYTSRLENFIRLTPDQYWWLHRRWKDPRGRPRRKKNKNRAA